MLKNEVNSKIFVRCGDNEGVRLNPSMTYIHDQLHPSTKSSPACDSVAGPIVEILMSNDTFNTLVVHIRRRFFNNEAKTSKK